MMLTALGLMSGTSLDGIDAALLETDGEARVMPGPSLTVPYDAQTRALLRSALDTARDFTTVRCVFFEAVSHNGFTGSNVQ